MCLSKNIILSTAIYNKVINITGWDSNWENNVLSASFVIPLFVDSPGESDELLDERKLGKGRRPYFARSQISWKSRTASASFYKKKMWNNTVRARNPNQKADLGLADASVFVLPLWVLGACQFESGINKRVSVWVISVHAGARACTWWYRTRAWRTERLLKVRRARNTSEGLRSLFCAMPDLILDARKILSSWKATRNWEKCGRARTLWCDNYL